MFVQDPYIRDLCWLCGLVIGVLAWVILNKRS
nr:MAG TPA: Myc target protein 1 [Caudoviricetes sp.]